MIFLCSIPAMVLDLVSPLMTLLLWELPPHQVEATSLPVPLLPPPATPVVMEPSLDGEELVDLAHFPLLFRELTPCPSSLTVSAQPDGEAASTATSWSVSTTEARDPAMVTLVAPSVRVAPSMEWPPGECLDVALTIPLSTPRLELSAPGFAAPLAMELRDVKKKKNFH